LKEAAAANKVPKLKSLAEWAKRTATRVVELVIANKRRGNQTSFSIASFVFLQRAKAALGLDQVLITIFGAAPIKQSFNNYFASLDLPIMNYYGLSETTGTTTCHSMLIYRLHTAEFA
jgi:long-subunit acyl-CoA synthetase (AMP-forming)